MLRQRRGRRCNRYFAECPERAISDRRRGTSKSCCRLRTFWLGLMSLPVSLLPALGLGAAARACLSGRDRHFRLFLGYQPQEQLPLGVVLGQRELPREEAQVFVVDKFFHGLLPSGIGRSSW